MRVTSFSGWTRWPRRAGFPAFSPATRVQSPVLADCPVGGGLVQTSSPLAKCPLRARCPQSTARTEVGTAHPCPQLPAPPGHLLLTCSGGGLSLAFSLSPSPRSRGPFRTSLGAGTAEGHDGCHEHEEGHAGSHGHPDDDGHRHGLCGREAGTADQRSSSPRSQGPHPVPSGATSVKQG